MISSNNEGSVQSILVFIIFDCFGRIPIFIRQKIGIFIGFLVSLFPSREKKIALKHISIFKLSQDPKTVVREVFQNLCQSILESINLAPLLHADIVSLSRDDLATFHRLFSTGRGLLVLTAHTGNWDLLGSYFCSLGYEVHTVGRELRSATIQSLLHEMRKRSGLKTIWRDGSSGNHPVSQNPVKSIISLLKKGGILAALIDQDTQVTSSFVPFLSVPAKTPSSLVDIAIKHNCEICIVFINRVQLTHYKITLIEVPKGLSRDEILLLYHQSLESRIREYPSQWVWFHKRWRTKPDNTTLGTKDYLAELESGKITPLNDNKKIQTEM